MLRLAAATATGPRDPAAAVKLLASDPILRDGWSAHLASWFAEWGKQDAAGALRWLRESRDADLPNGEILTSFLRERKADTVGPLLAAAGLSEAEIVERARFMDGNGEPGEWWAEVQHLAPGPVRDALLTKAATRVLQSCGGRPDLLTDVLAEAVDPAARVALETAIREQSDEDRWQVLTDPSLPVTPEGVYKLATQRPRETAEALLQRPDSTPEQWQHLAAGWAEVDAPDAAQWLTKQPDSPVVRKAIVSLAARWAVSDPATASGWLATMPDSPVRDEAVVELVGHLDGPRVEPDAALHWALTITDANLRDQVLEGAFRRWVAVDPEAAGEALQSAENVPLDTRNRLLRKAGLSVP